MIDTTNRKQLGFIYTSLVRKYGCGGRDGRRLCKAWGRSPIGFFSDMAESYTRGAYLFIVKGARIINKKNCLWVSPQSYVEMRKQFEEVEVGPEVWVSIGHLSDQTKMPVAVIRKKYRTRRKENLKDEHNRSVEQICW